MSGEQVQRIEDMARSGHSLPEIARELGRPHGTIRNALRALGVRAKALRVPLTALQERQIFTLYAELQNKNEVARRLGIDAGMVRRRLRAMTPAMVVGCDQPACRRENCKTNPAKFGHRFEDDLRCVECGVAHTEWRLSPSVCNRFESLEAANRAELERRAESSPYGERKRDRLARGGG